MNFEIIGPEAEALLGWHALADALEAGHRLPVAGIGDTFLYRGADTLLSRSAWIDGMGIAVKSATIFPGNPAQGIPAVNGGVMLYSDAAGLPEALVDFHLVTRWKTAGDSFLAAYSPIVERSRDTPWGERERAFQLYRRGRYVEFNLVFDRGTLFGLQSGGRTESILMSLPPLVRWEYGYTPEADSDEARLAQYLAPRDWLGESR